MLLRHFCSICLLHTLYVSQSILCHSSDDYLPASQYGYTGSIPGQIMYDLWWTKCLWDTFFWVFWVSPAIIPPVLHIYHHPHHQLSSFWVEIWRDTVSPQSCHYNHHQHCFKLLWSCIFIWKVSLMSHKNIKTLPPLCQASLSSHFAAAENGHCVSLINCHSPSEVWK
jgi:hypothetical protein